MGESSRESNILRQLVDEVHQLRTLLGEKVANIEHKVGYVSDVLYEISSKLDAVPQLTCTLVAEASKDALKPPSPLPTLPTPRTGSVNLPGIASYPDGSWLGDPDDAGQRVRSPISQQNLLHINSTFQAPEKMALALLDYLFSREELASSNISGRSRNNKKQLDPMMVYGIRCHLQYLFHITAKEWTRICLNMDSKCRSAWKRRLKNSGQNFSSKISQPKPAQLPDDMSFDFDQLNSGSLELSCVKVLSASPCSLRILGAEGYGEELGDEQGLQEGARWGRSATHTTFSHRTQPCTDGVVKMERERSPEGVIIIQGSAPTDDSILELAVGDPLNSGHHSPARCGDCVDGCGDCSDHHMQSIVKAESSQHHHHHHVNSDDMHDSDHDMTHSDDGGNTRYLLTAASLGHKST